MSSALDQFERQLVVASRELADLNATGELAAGTDEARRPRAARRTRRHFSQRRLLLPLLATLIVAGGVAAASSLLWPSQRLADGTVNCFMATHGKGELRDHTLAVGDGKANGQPAISYCRMWYRINRYRLDGSTNGPKVADLPLIACQQNPTTVSVYVATGRSDQCHILGEKPLPKTYGSAARRLRDLQQALLAIQAERNCASVMSIAGEARAVLVDRGFTHWRVITPPPDPGKHWLFGYSLPAGTGGTCGLLLTDSYGPSTIADVDPQRQTVTVSVGPPRTIARTVNRVIGQLLAQASQRCYTTTSIRPLARHLLANTTLQPRFATVAGPQGVSFVAPLAERLYEQGCVRPFLASPGNNNRFIDILLNARGAPRLPAGDVYPPARDFRP